MLLRCVTIGASPQAQLSQNTEADPEMTTKNPLNQILFGPPGTGKTYATIDAALSILLPPDVLSSLNGQRSELKKRFDELVKEGRVRFVTFHQSFSYEDFVEGLRADIADEGETTGQLCYRVESGVFKKICDDARTLPVTKAVLGLKENPRIWKISIDGVHASATRQYCLEHSEARIGWGHVGDLQTADLNNPSFQLGSNDRSCLQQFSQDIEIGDVLVCKRSNTEAVAIGVVKSEYRFDATPPKPLRDNYNHVLSVNWIQKDLKLSILPLNGGKGLTMKTVYELDRFTWPDLVESLGEAGYVLPELKPSLKQEAKPFVLIIDEINRGSASRIFGELITLIEPSKRLGQVEALEVTLPYSKRRFAVPDNVYLIGTMNTADRSLTGLDIALRRRFIFREMPPKAQLLKEVNIEGVNIGDLLERMNNRIEVLLDRDHCLGHAYFMHLKEDGNDTMENLSLIFKHQVIPLLQEYFFEDWERICWVLNDHRKKNESDRFIQQPKTDITSLFGSDVGGTLQERRWRINEDAFERAEAYSGIIDHDAFAPMDASSRIMDRNNQVRNGSEVAREVTYDGYLIRQLPSKTIELTKDGIVISPVKPVLKTLAEKLNVSSLNSKGGDHNTRQLGQLVIDTANALQIGSEAKT